MAPSLEEVTVEELASDELAGTPESATEELETGFEIFSLEEDWVSPGSLCG